MAEFTGFQTVGVIRFSLLTEDFETNRLGPAEDHARVLFAEERLAHRFRLFEKLCLHTLRQQTDPEFELIVLTSEALPEPWATRLRDLVQAQANMAVVARPRGKNYPMIREAYGLVPPDGSSHRLSFRLDDDDAVDLDFIARIKRTGRALLPLHRKSTPILMNFNRGFFVDLSEGAPRRVIDVTERAPLALGTTLLHLNGQNVTPYRYNHRNFPLHYNLYTDVDVPAFLRTVHGFNASTPYRSGWSERMEEAECLALVERHFGMDAAHMASL